MNSNVTVIGNSGSGKTTLAHQLIKSQMILGYRFLIIDFLGNYIRWAKDMPQSYNVIRIDQTSGDAVNPCDIVIPDNELLQESENFK